MYYNTTGLNTEELKKETRKAKSLEQRILEFYEQGGKYAAFQVQEALGDNRDSTKRAINTLENRQLLSKSDKIIGDCGKTVNTWELKQTEPQFELAL